MNLQTLAAIAAAVDVAVAVCACMGGYLMFRHTRLPAWSAALLMLPIVRALGVMIAYAIHHPARGGFPGAEAAVAGAVTLGLAWELRRARRTPVAVSLVDIASTDHGLGAHADAA